MSPDRIRSLRKALGMTQEQLANALGVTRKTVNNWEGGRAKPRELHVQALERMRSTVQDLPEDDRDKLAERLVAAGTATGLLAFSAILSSFTDD